MQDQSSFPNFSSGALRYTIAGEENWFSLTQDQIRDVEELVPDDSRVALSRGFVVVDLQEPEAVAAVSASVLTLEGVQDLHVYFSSVVTSSEVEKRVGRGSALGLNSDAEGPTTNDDVETTWTCIKLCGADADCVRRCNDKPEDGSGG